MNSKITITVLIDIETRQVVRGISVTTLILNCTVVTSHHDITCFDVFVNYALHGRCCVLTLYYIVCLNTRKTQSTTSHMDLLLLFLKLQYIVHKSQANARAKLRRTTPELCTPAKVGPLIRNHKP